MTSRDDLIARIATDLAEGGMVGRCTIFDVLSDQPPLIDAEEECTLIAGSTEQRNDILDRLQKYAETLVVAWLQTSARGASLVDDEVERLSEEAAEDAEESAA